MGKKKVDPFKVIPEGYKRVVTLSKRKRGLVKKCIELSKMCEQYISLTIFDKQK